MSIIYVPDIECDSCVKLITRKLKERNITGFSIGKDHVSVEGNVHEIVSIIKSLGFRASTSPFERKTLKERMRHVKENSEHYELEITGLKHALKLFLVLSILTVFSYVGFLKTIPNFLSIYGWWIFYLILTITTISVGVWHYYAYRAKMTCMIGMMIGMTFGMQTGMMLGAVIGATNGFFVGCMVGMLVGVAIGAITGKCCGVMGVMEGMMAGLMGGTMGAMITVMMFSDHLLWFMPFYMIINMIIVAGLSYMLYEEVVEGNQEVVKQPFSFTILASLAVIVMFVVTVIMLYGPRSALISF